MCSNVDFATTQKRLPGANIQTEHCTYVMMNNCKSLLFPSWVRKTLQGSLLYPWIYSTCFGFKYWSEVFPRAWGFLLGVAYTTLFLSMLGFIKTGVHRQRRDLSGPLPMNLLWKLLGLINYGSYASQSLNVMLFNLKLSLVNLFYP